MRPSRRRSPRVAAVVGLVTGLALLLAAVVDGGMAAPTRADVSSGTTAAASSDPVATVSPAREDQASWGLTVPAPGVAVLLAGLAALVAVIATGGAPVVTGPSHRAPALLAARHRGPPRVV